MVGCSTFVEKPRVIGLREYPTPKAKANGLLSHVNGTTAQPLQLLRLYQVNNYSIPMEPKTLKIDDVEYVRKDSVKTEAKKLDGMKYVVVRGYQSGVWAGYLQEQEGTKVILVNARNIWYWKGAASLAQLSQEGIKDLKESKITQEIPEMTLLDANTVVQCSEQARQVITDAPVWKA